MEADNQKSLVGLVETLVKALVDHPEKIEVEEVSGQKRTIFKVKTLKEDRGKVIGKGGRTEKSLRTIIGGASAKLKRRSQLDFVEDD